MRWNTFGTAIPAAAILTTLLACQPMTGGQERQGNGASLYPPLSYDGRYVAFYSEATNLVPDDSNEAGDIFVHDTQAETTTRVSVASDGQQGNLESTFPSISGDGRYVAFSSSATNLVSGDTNDRPDVFVHDLETGATTRVNISSAGEQADGASYCYFPSISADGRFVAFASTARSLVENDNNGTWDTFVHDRQTGVTTLVSASTSGEHGNAPSLHAVISGNGRYMAFHSYATNLVQDDANGVEDVFVRDQETGATTRVSLGPSGQEADRGSDRAAISHDGNIVAFSSTATNLVPDDTNNSEDVFVRDVGEPDPIRVSVSSAGQQMRVTGSDLGDALCCAVSTLCCVIVITDRKSVMAPDGGSIVYRSDADNLVEEDRNSYQDIFVYDRADQSTSRVSVDSRGIEGNRASVHHGVSFDGRFVAFSSEASNLVQGDTNRVSDVFVHDRETGVTTRVSVRSREGGGIGSLTIGIAGLLVLTAFLGLVLLMGRRRRRAATDS